MYHKCALRLTMVGDRAYVLCWLFLGIGPAASTRSGDTLLSPFLSSQPLRTGGSALFLQPLTEIRRSRAMLVSVVSPSV